jgi:hypothetical protein
MSRAFLRASLALFAAGCGAGGTGRLPAGFSRTAAGSVPRSNLELRSVDNFGFTTIVASVPRARVPGPALARASQSCPGTPSGYRQMIDDGDERWGVVVGAAEQTCEVVSESSGALCWVRKNVPTDPVPGELRATLQSFGDSRVIEIERRRGPEADDYVVELETLAGKRYLLVVSTSGEIIHRLRRYPGLVDLPESD